MSETSESVNSGIKTSVLHKNMHSGSHWDDFNERPYAYVSMRVNRNYPSKLTLIWKSSFLYYYRRKMEMIQKAVNS